MYKELCSDQILKCESLVEVLLFEAAIIMYGSDHELRCMEDPNGSTGIQKCNRYLVLLYVLMRNLDETSRGFKQSFNAV